MSTTTGGHGSVGDRTPQAAATLTTQTGGTSVSADTGIVHAVAAVDELRAIFLTVRRRMSVVSRICVIIMQY